MGAPRDFSHAPWRLKLYRAQHHMKELELELGRYANRNPYEARRLDKGDADPNRWLWTLHFTEQPDLSLAIVLGDVLTNIRASLDHLAAALAPGRKKNIFPIVADVGKFNPHPTAVDAKRYEAARKNFAKAVEGMHPDAKAIIERLQPYYVNPMAADGTPQVHAILELNRLVQTDKHQQLVPIAAGLSRARSFIFIRSLSLVKNLGWYADFHDEGAIVADYNVTQLVGVPESEVQVHIHGTPRITVEMVKSYGKNDVVEIARDVIDFLATDVFPSLEPFIPL
jgi:hypothetical protein